MTVVMDILNFFKIKVDINSKCHEKTKEAVISIIIKTALLLKKLISSCWNTTGSLSLALSAAYRKIKIAHIEASLRTFQKCDLFGGNK